jgi:hypothetical protein
LQPRRRRQAVRAVELITHTIPQRA